MPLQGAEWVNRDRSDILSFLESELRSEFGEDIDLTQSSAFSTFAEALATLDAEQIDPAFKEVVNSAYLDTATGEQLEKLVAILGISRRSAIHSTGTIQFDHGSIVGQNYTITNGSIVQTDSNDPVEFETTELVTLTWFDDFESGSLRSAYAGDVGSFSVVDGTAASDPSPTEGSGELKADANSGDKVFVANSSLGVGATMDFQFYLQDTDNTTNTELGNLFGVIDSSNHYRIKIDSNGTHAIEVETTGGGTNQLTSSSHAPPENEWLTNRVIWSPENAGQITSQIIDSSGTILDELQVTDEDTIEEGGYGFEQLGGTENAYWDHSGERSVLANARCRTGGTIGNIGANSLTIMPSVPNGVQTVTNLYPMGDDSHYLTTLLPFDTGIPEETDQELRARTRRGEGNLGKGTIPALIAAARGLPEAESVTVYENKTNTDNTPSGLPPTAFELVYYGTDSDQDVADMLHETRAFTARDHGGAHGTQKSETVDADNGQTFTYEWTEPTQLNVDMTLGIVVNDQFIGGDELRDRVTTYIGGTLSDGTTELGTGVDEDVYVDQVEDVVTGPSDTGVIGISNYSFTPSVTTDANGLEIVDVGANEVANTNAEDSSITLNITRV